MALPPMQAFGTDNQAALAASGSSPRLVVYFKFLAPSGAAECRFSLSPLTGLESIICPWTVGFACRYAAALTHVCYPTRLRRS